MAVLLAANASFISPSPFHIANPDMSAVLWGMTELNERVIDYGYGGIELHWSDALQHCRDLTNADPAYAQRIGRGIVSAHEGWRGTADPIPAYPERTPLRPQTGDQLIVRIGSAVLFPSGADSLDKLEAVEEKLNRPTRWHYVQFPDQEGKIEADRTKTKRFPDSSIQPTVDVGACWGARTVDDFVEQLGDRGYKATLDSFHISRDGKMVEGSPNWDWEALAQRLLDDEVVPEVHVSVGRSDFARIDPKRYKESQRELRALVDNGDLSDTSLGKLGQMLRDRQWTGNVVIEATIPGLAATFGRITPKILGELHQSMTAGVKQMLPHTYWLAPIASGRVTYV